MVFHTAGVKGGWSWLLAAQRALDSLACQGLETPVLLQGDVRHWIDRLQALRRLLWVVSEVGSRWPVSSVVCPSGRVIPSSSSDGESEARLGSTDD